MSVNDVTNEEQRAYWQKNYSVPNDVRCYKENDRWLFPVAMRAVSSHNLDSRQSERNEKGVVLDPHLTSHDSTPRKLSCDIHWKISIYDEAWTSTWWT